MPRPTDAQVRALAEFAFTVLTDAHMGWDIDAEQIDDWARDFGVVPNIRIRRHRWPRWLLEAAGQTTLSEDGTNG